MVEVVIKDFIDKVRISEKRRPVYYKFSDKIPLKYQTEDYVFTALGMLIDKNTGQRVIKNNKSVGKERFWKISGQDLWSGINPHLRSKIAKEMKKYFYEFFRDIPPIENYPIGISIEFYDDHMYDLDNQGYIYVKTIMDCLCGNVDFVRSINDSGEIEYTPDKESYPPKIIDDSNKYVKEFILRYFDSKDRKLIVNIYEVSREL